MCLSAMFEGASVFVVLLFLLCVLLGVCLCLCKGLDQRERGGNRV